MVRWTWTSSGSRKPLPSSKSAMVGSAVAEPRKSYRCIHSSLEIFDTYHPPPSSSNRTTKSCGSEAGLYHVHEVGDPALGLLPWFRAGRFLVRDRVVRVGVLVGLPAAGDLGGQPVGVVFVFKQKTAYDITR